MDICVLFLGLPYTKTFRLTNTSPVSVTFKLRIPGDGSGPVVTCYEQMRNNTDPSWRKGIHFYVKPKEFTMTPSQGTILAQGHQDIEVWEESSHTRFSTRAEASLECGRALALPALSIVCVRDLHRCEASVS